MLENKIRTQEEIEEYMAELKNWLNQERDLPPEEMAGFFARRLDLYDTIHLEHWANEYAHIADFFDCGLHTLLDLGCGTGLELKALYQRFPYLKVTGIDLSEAMLMKLREQYVGKDLELILSDYFKYPFPAEYYDAALSVQTLHHFPYEKKQNIYTKLFQALKPGGYYVECDYIACCKEEEDLCLEQYFYKRNTNHIADDMFVHIDIPLTLDHQTTLMENAGFRQIRVLYGNCGTMIIRADK